MKPSVKTILWSLVAGVGVAVLGAVVAALFGTWMNGFSRESATLFGQGLYLCLVVVVCNGVILYMLKK